MNAAVGKGLILLGAGIVAAGLLVYFFHGKLRWLGRLPGDIRIEREHVRFYAPLATMLLLSLLLSAVLWVVRKLF